MPERAISGLCVINKIVFFDRENRLVRVNPKKPDVILGAVTKTHGLCGLNNKHALRTVLEAGQPTVRMPAWSGSEK